MARIRLDKLLVKRDFAANEFEAAEIIESGEILVNGAIQTSVNSFVDAGSAIEFAPKKSKYVSRGGFKLEKALNEFSISPLGKRCLDVGASTGGFTDCLLQNGATHVIALDVGHGQLDLSIRNDKRVSVFEKTNAKKLSLDLIGQPCQLAVMDVSFTSVKPLIDSVISCLDNIEFIILIKPQFEVEQKQINARGVATDPESHLDCINEILSSLNDGLAMTGICVSPIKGAKGNIEYLGLIKDGDSLGQGESPVQSDRIREVVVEAFSTKETND